MKKIDNHYRGWDIFYSAAAPVTGRHRAVRHGVTMNANTVEAIKHMIDLRHEDARQAKAAREAS